jgi:hypothetical protein
MKKTIDTRNSKPEYKTFHYMPAYQKNIDQRRDEKEQEYATIQQQIINEKD